MAPSLATGTIFGRYEIRLQLGAGGMGEVYLAEDTKLISAGLAMLPMLRESRVKPA